MLEEVIACCVDINKIAYVTLDKGVEKYTNQYVKQGGITVSAEATILNYCTRNCAEIMPTKVIEVTHETAEICNKIMNKGHNGIIVDEIIF